MRLFVSLFFCAFCLLPALSLAAQQTSELEQRIQKLESKVSQLDRATRPIRQANTALAAGSISFLFGAFCALWAQNTGRSAWFWFVVGSFFTIIAVVCLLVKNSKDRRAEYDKFSSKRRKAEKAMDYR